MLLSTGGNIMRLWCTFMAAVALVALASGAYAANYSWHWSIDGTCDPICVGTADGKWAFNYSGAGIEPQRVPGKELYWEIVDIGRGNKAIHVVDNWWEGNETDPNKYQQACIQWSPHTLDTDMPPAGVPAFESYREDCTGGTFVIRFKVDSFTPRTSNPVKTKRFFSINYQYSADDPGDSSPDPVNKGIKLESWCGSWTGEANKWGILFYGDNRFLSDQNGIINFCDGQWHELWIIITPETDEPGVPGKSKYDIYVDGILRLTFYRGGGAPSGLLGFEQTLEKIDAYIDYVCFSYQAIPYDDLDIPDDTQVLATSDNIGEMKKNMDTSLAGALHGSEVKMVSKVVSAVYSLPHVESESQSVVVTSGYTSKEPQVKTAIFIEEADESAGIMVRSTGGTVVDTNGASVDLVLGDIIDVYGALWSGYGEKGVAAWKVVKTGHTADIPKPVGVIHRTIETALNSFLGAPANPEPNIGKGLDCFGMRVATVGKIKFIDDIRKFLYIDEGSSFMSGALDVGMYPATSIPGVKVWWTDTSVVNGSPFYVGEKVYIRGHLGTSRFISDSVAGTAEVVVPTIWAEELNYMP